MYKVGLTGGIGSGKSTVAQMFASRGVAVIDADQVARELVEPGNPALDDIKQHFGEGVCKPDGSLDRAALRERVFSDPTQRRQLEAILHPLILARMHAAAEHAPGPYCILVMPLLLEAQQQHTVNRVLVIDCAPELQRQRAMSRDGASTAEVDRIMAAQLSREQRLAAAHDVLVNDGDLQQLETQVQALHQRYLQTARS